MATFASNDDLDDLIVTIDDGELSDEDLDVVVGGLARPWSGTWNALELGASLGLADGADPSATSVGGPGR